MPSSGSRSWRSSGNIAVARSRVLRAGEPHHGGRGTRRSARSSRESECQSTVGPNAPGTSRRIDGLERSIPSLRRKPESAGKYSIMWPSMSTTGCGRPARISAAVAVMRAEANRRLLAPQVSACQTLRPMGPTAKEAAAVVRRLAAQGLLIGDDWVASGGAGTSRAPQPVDRSGAGRGSAGGRTRHRLRRQRRARRAARVAGGADHAANGDPAPARRPARRAPRRGVRDQRARQRHPDLDHRLRYVHGGRGLATTPVGSTSSPARSRRCTQPTTSTSCSTSRTEWWR